MKTDIFNVPSFINLSAMVVLAFAGIWFFDVILADQTVIQKEKK